MVDSTSSPQGFSLKRWSRRKLDAARADGAAPAPAPASAVAIAPAPVAAMTTASPDAGLRAPIDDTPALPPIESLTQDSDFSAFMQPKVDEVLKRAALKKLFTDPHFNVMDGLDIYIGDYTQADPMPEGMLDKLGKVYGMAKEAVAADDAVPDGSSTVPTDEPVADIAPDPATAVAGSSPPHSAEPDASPVLATPHAPVIHPVSTPEPSAIMTPPAAPERPR